MVSHTGRWMRSFQSTLPMRGATRIETECFVVNWYFNPRSPCGERRFIPSRILSQIRFQSTLPMRGATRCYICRVRLHLEFQSTLPMRGATFVR